MDRGDDDGCHLDQVDESNGQQTKANIKLTKVDNPEDSISHEIDHKHPLLVHVILDVLFKMLPFEELKKCRLVSSTLKEVGTLELSKKSLKPIKFTMIEELEEHDKLGALVQLNRQLFSNFSFKISLLSSPQIDTFLENFSPKSVEIVGESRRVHIHQVGDLFKFLIKISPSVEEIKFENNFNYSKDDKQGEEHVEELTSTPFPNLRKISYHVGYLGLKLFLYSIIGQKSPKLRHLDLESILSEMSFGSPEFMKEQFEQTGLMSKLQILDLVVPERGQCQDYLKVFTEFGQNGVLKLTKLKFQPEKEEFKNIFAPLIESQAKTLEILEISTRFSAPSYNPPPAGTPRTQVSFPSLQNLAILQIDYFSMFEAIFDPINFSIQFPKLVEFKTSDIETFLVRKLGRGGDSVKSVTLLKDRKIKKESNLFTRKKLYFDQIFEIFPNLEFLEVDVFNFLPKVPFRSQLRKVVIHCELEDLCFLRKELLQEAKKVELFVNCESKLIVSDEESYKNFLGGLMMQEFRSGGRVVFPDHFNRNKYYQKFLERISQDFTSLHSASFTFIGYKISEDFKREFRALLPRCDFICSPFEASYDDI